MLDQLKNLILSDWKALIGGAILALILLITAVRSVQKLAKVRNLAEKAVGPVMFGGMIWSAEAVWHLTEGHATIAVRVATCAVLEFLLLIAMARAKESMRINNHPGRSGQSAWLFASVIALVAFVAGVFLYHSVVEAVLRPAIPLLLTKLWWDGILGEGPRKTGSFKYSPRNVLIRWGWIEADERDVKTVNRDRLIQRMADMYYDSLYGPEGKRAKLRSKLARKTLDADDAMIAEVMTRVRRTGWTTAKPLPYDPTQPADASADAPVTQPDASGDAPSSTRLTHTPARRIKDLKQVPTSGDAADAAELKRAVDLVLTQGLSPRKAAEAVPGTSASTIERRVKRLRSTQPDAPADAALTHPQTNGHPVLAESTN